MYFRRSLWILGFCSIAAISCGNRGEDKGASTPIDSTVEHGTAPATYGGDNPANDQDTTYQNANDTSTKANDGPSNRR